MNIKINKVTKLEIIRGKKALMSLKESKSFKRRYVLPADVELKIYTDEHIIRFYAKAGFMFDGRSGSPLLDWYLPNLGTLEERCMWLIHDLLGYATCLSFKCTNKVLRYGLRDVCKYRSSKAFVVEKAVSISDSWYGAPKENEWCYANINKFNILITKYILDTTRLIQDIPN